MKTKITAVAYPTIPVIFVASVREDRTPVHNTMGLAVTDLKGETRTETIVTKTQNDNELTFFYDGKQLEKERIASAEKAVNIFRKESCKNWGLKIESNNYKIFSGSSDSGAAALVVALNDLFETGFSKERLAEIGNMVSESAVRAVYGGLNMMVVEPSHHFYGKLLASHDDLKDIRIFGMGFNYEARVSAEEIFQLTRSNPFFDYRLKMVPVWVAKIKLGLLNKDWNSVFGVAEDNCSNAHYLIESSGKRCRRKEMMNAVIDVEEIRASGLPVYWTAGGGKIINAITWEPHAAKVREEFVKRGQSPIDYKVAPGAHVIKSE